jgi:hypothetical protein
MKRKRMVNDAVGLTAAGFALGVGGSLPGAGPSTQAMASMLPSVGTAMGGGYAINAMMGMVPKKKR